MKKVTIITGIIVVLLFAMSMFLYANPGIFEFLTALFLKALILVKLKLPLLMKGLWLSLKKFLFGLTFVKVTILGVKRYIIDHVISKNLQEHFFVHLKAPLKNWWAHFDVRKKLFFFIPVSIISAIGLYLAGIGKLLNFLGIKTLVIGFFKGLWVLSAKAFAFFTVTIWTTWFAPILEILVFSWLLAIAEKVPVLKTIFDKIYAVIYNFFSRIGSVMDRFLHIPMQNKMNKMGKRLGLYIKKKNRQARKQREQEEQHQQTTPVSEPATAKPPIPDADKQIGEPPPPT